MLLFYLAAGINHFRMPAFYLPLIPDYLPAKTWLNAISGIGEIAAAVMLGLPAWRRLGCYCIIALLIAFIPAHIWFIQRGGCLDPAGLCVPVWVAWVRLIVIHPLLFFWAWYHRNDGINGSLIFRDK